MGEFDWVGKYVDAKGLAKEIIEKSKKVKVKSPKDFPITSLDVVFSFALEWIKSNVDHEIGVIRLREVKLELEKKKAERALKETENLGTTD